MNSSQVLPVRAGRLCRPRRSISNANSSGYVEASAVTVAPTLAKAASVAFPMTDVIAGGLARAASQSTIHPLDTVKVRMQAAIKSVKNVVPKKVEVPVSSGKYGIGAGAAATGNAAGSAVSLSGKRVFAARAVAAKAGAEVASLYKGVLGAAGGAGIAIGAYFAFYGAAKQALEQHTDFSVSTIAFVAGGIGALGSSVVKVPAAVCIRSVQANVYPNVIAAASRITKTAGPKGLFTGYIPTLLEDVPDMAVKFAAYETMRMAHRRFTNKSIDDASPVADISMGLIAGSVAAGATTPLDVVKTRMMVDAAKSPSFIGAIKDVWKTSSPGIGRVNTFFTGVGPRAFSNGVNSAIFFCFFEAMRSDLRRREERRKLEEAQRAAEAPGAGIVTASGYRGGRAVDAVYTSNERQVRVTEASITLAHASKRE